MSILNSKRQCIKCKHLLTYTTCKAFPERIPNLILFGLINHNKKTKEQIGNYTYEIKEEYIESDKKQKQIDLEVLTLYKISKEKLPIIIFDKVIELGYEQEKINRIELKGSISNDGGATIGLTIFLEKEKIALNVYHIFSDTHFFKHVGIIERAEKLINRPTPWLKLSIFNNKDYEYEWNE